MSSMRMPLVALVSLFIVGCPEDEDSLLPSSLENCSKVSLDVGERALPRFDGVDIVISVDDSLSMAQVEEKLSTAVYTLVSMLTRPLGPEADPSWKYPAADNVRVAVVSSDMGLQWGERFDDEGVKIGGNTGGNRTEIPGCGNDTGQNGAFLSITAESVELPSGVIPCEEGGGQCPEGFVCNIFVCEASTPTLAVGCPDGSVSFAEHTVFTGNGDFATEAACMVDIEAGSCRVEQQLESVMRGIESHASPLPEENFLVDSHLLAVVVVSDQEDCSIRDKGLFLIDGWTPRANDQQPVACNVSSENETYLFPANGADASRIADWHGIPIEDLPTYYSRLIAMKDGQAPAVLFSAIVGVPSESEGVSDNTCQDDGVGLASKGCLEHPEMQIRLTTVSSPDGDDIHEEFAPACVRKDESGNEVTRAVPGRRFVKVAEEFGPNGAVSSICNDDWGPAMGRFAEMIAERLATNSCYPYPLDWGPTPTADCPNCGVSSCELVVDFQRSGDQINDSSCPAALYAGLGEAEAEALRRRVSVEEVQADDGTVVQKIVSCPLPKVAAPLDCDLARVATDPKQDQVGWYYCETPEERFGDACDGMAEGCGGGCRYGVELTRGPRGIVSGQFIKTRCVFEEKLDDGECRLSEESRFGERCEQPGFPEDPERYMRREKGLAQLSFQKGCDCLSYALAIRDENQVIVDHFCTSPCTDGCPSGYECETLFANADDRPEGVSSHYCVPSCVVHGCPQVRHTPDEEQERQVCVPEGEGIAWGCRWPEAREVPVDGGS